MENSQQKIVYDKTNARVVSADDSKNAFYTDQLECGDEVINEVIRLFNETENKDALLGSEGTIDRFLLDAPCSQEDREIIVEDLFVFLYGEQ